MKYIKGYIIWFLKCIVAGITAIVILSVFSFFYYNHGTRRTSETGATDYSWENRFHSIGYEGFAWGMNDSYGYNNVCRIDMENIDILLMGSSHMNAYNVPQKCSVPYLLNRMIETSNKIQGGGVYNIGMEGHTFYICSDNLKDALETYSPQKYVIMETRSVKLSMERMEEVLKGTRKRTPAFDSGLIYYMQKVPYFCLLHRQIRDMCGLNDVSLADTDTADKVIDSGSDDTLENITLDYNTQLNQYMEKLAKEVNSYNVKLLIFYMPSISINDDGTVGIVGDPQDTAEFASACKNYGIEFLDMSDVFLENYKQNYELPFGFSNTEAGRGHLNRRGHELVASALFDKMKEIEGE